MEKPIQLARFLVGLVRNGAGIDYVYIGISFEIDSINPALTSYLPHRLRFILIHLAAERVDEKSLLALILRIHNLILP